MVLCQMPDIDSKSIGNTLTHLQAQLIAMDSYDFITKVVQSNRVGCLIVLGPTIKVWFSVIINLT